MSKEYMAYRFFILVYVLVIANSALMIAEDIYYYILFCSSIGLLAVLIFYEKRKVISFLKHLFDYKLSNYSYYLVAFLFAYPMHYESYKHLNYFFIALLQSINVILCMIVFGIEKKSVNTESI